GGDRLLIQRTQRRHRRRAARLAVDYDTHERIDVAVHPPRTDERRREALLALAVGLMARSAHRELLFPAIEQLALPLAQRGQGLCSVDLLTLPSDVLERFTRSSGIRAVARCEGDQCPRLPRQEYGSFFALFTRDEALHALDDRGIQPFLLGIEQTKQSIDVRRVIRLQHGSRERDEHWRYRATSALGTVLQAREQAQLAAGGAAHDRIGHKRPIAHRARERREQEGGTIGRCGTERKRELLLKDELAPLGTRSQRGKRALRVLREERFGHARRRDRNPNFGIFECPSDGRP